MSNKKKVIVPIIIGVLLLIVFVAGATYAYFTASNSASGTTSIDTTTEKVGTVIVSNPTENLYLKLSAYDMQESMKGTSYYATNDSSKSYETELSNYTISEYSITGGEEDTVYNCTYKLNITKPSQILAGDMSLKLQLNGATIDGSNTLDVDLANVSSSYTVSFSAIGNTSGTLVTGGIVFNNTTSEQNHLVGQTLSTTITNSDLDCSVGETIASICTLADDSTVAAGEYGAKYNCKVDPNKDAYTFYLIDNNEDGTSDLIMSHNINAAGEEVIPNESSDLGMVAWYADDYDNSFGPTTAMTYLHNATKSWTNVEPISYTYNDKEVQASEYGYTSFKSTNGIAVITGSDGTSTTIGSETEPLRARMPVYTSNSAYSSLSEVSDKTSTNEFLYNNLDSEWINGPYGYWTLSSYPDFSDGAWFVRADGIVSSDHVGNDGSYGVRPVITLKV